MDVVWLSANRLGFELLKEAMKIETINIKALITLSQNSKTKMYDYVPIDDWKKIGLDAYFIDEINNVAELIAKLNPDLIVMCGWRQIIEGDILAIPTHGFISFHPTLLPIGRGPAPIINSIWNGFHESGLTMYHVSENLDAGDIIGQEKYSILPTDHAFDVYEKVIHSGKILIQKYLPLLSEGKAPRAPQNESRATFFSKPTKDFNRINLEDGIDIAFLKIRALSHPYSGAYIEIAGKKLIIWNAEVSE